MSPTRQRGTSPETVGIGARAALDSIQGDDPAAVLIRGGSCIVDPLGTVLVEPSFEGEAIRVAEIDRRIIARGNYDLDVVGHYARPDVFNLTVDTSAKSAVSFVGERVFAGESDREIGAVADAVEGVRKCLD
jgi:nitrilase